MPARWMDTYTRLNTSTGEHDIPLTAADWPNNFEGKQMKTNRALHIVDHYWAIDVPAGVDVIFVKGDGGGYALKDPRPYGVSEHDHRYRYAWVPKDAVSGL